MSASLNYRAAEARDGVSYVVTVSVTAAVEIPEELFVFDLQDRFSHVATLLDLLMYPPSKAEATASNQSYYRAASMRYVDADPASVRAARDAVVSRLKAVLTAFKASMPTNFGSVLEEGLT